MPPWMATLALGLIREAPALVYAGAQVYESIKARRQARKSQDNVEGADIQALTATIEDIAGHVEAVEETSESQADIVFQLVKHNATLVRWLFILTVSGLISSGVAIAALLLVIVW